VWCGVVGGLEFLKFGGVEGYCDFLFGCGLSLVLWQCWSFGLGEIDCCLCECCCVEV
jgi:hypothetical protein